MIFIVPRAEFNCPPCDRAITISPRADKLHIALLLMLLLILIAHQNQRQSIENIRNFIHFTASELSLRRRQ